MAEHLNTSSKRRSSISVFAPWMAALPSPTDTPAVIDQADREQSAWAYSGILAGPVHLPPPNILGTRPSLTTASGTGVSLTPRGTTGGVGLGATRGLAQMRRSTGRPGLVRASTLEEA